MFDNFFIPEGGRKHFRGGFGPVFHGRGRMHGPGGGGRGRGDLKYEILSVLRDGPRHGYDIMLEIEARRGGVRPSPGSIYPALQMLEDGDFVRGEERDGKRTYTICDKGLELLNERPAGDEPTIEGDNLYAIFADAMRQVHGVKDAAKQIARTGNLDLIKRAIAVLDKTRRDLFAILADDL